MEDGGWRMCPPLESEESLRPVCLTGTVTCQVLGLTMWRVRGMVAALVPQMMVVTRRAAEKSNARLAEAGSCSEMMRSCCSDGVGLLSAVITAF